MNKPRILLIDDEEKIHQFISISLTAEGFEYLGCRDASSGLECFQNDKPNLIILDLGLPDVDGSAVLAMIRKVGNIPILVLTAREQSAEKVKLLNAGANDYLSKPFEIKELIARVKVLLRDIQYEPIPAELHFENLIIRTFEPMVFIKNTSIHLTKKEHQLLLLLAINPGVLISQKKILVAIWGEFHSGDSHYLRVLITHLRKKLKDDAEDPIYIKTEPGIGYRFIC